MLSKIVPKSNDRSNAGDENYNLYQILITVENAYKYVLLLVPRNRFGGAIIF